MHMFDYLLQNIIDVSWKINRLDDMDSNDSNDVSDLKKNWKKLKETGVIGHKSSDDKVSFFLQEI